MCGGCRLLLLGEASVCCLLLLLLLAARLLLPWMRPPVVSPHAAACSHQLAEWPCCHHLLLLLLPCRIRGVVWPGVRGRVTCRSLVDPQNPCAAWLAAPPLCCAVDGKDMGVPQGGVQKDRGQR